MSANSRLTIAAHALAWIGLYQRQGHEVATSEQIAASANTNPVVIRRLLGELRRSGLVESRRGVGAGWSLARELGSMTLLDVYEAVEPGPLFAMHRTTPDQGCVVGHGIQPHDAGRLRGHRGDREARAGPRHARRRTPERTRDTSLASPSRPGSARAATAAVPSQAARNRGCRCGRSQPRPTAGGRRPRRWPCGRPPLLFRFRGRAGVIPRVRASCCTKSTSPSEDIVTLVSLTPHRLVQALDRFNAAHPWDHNAHYHRWILRQLPRRFGSALDVGSGTGDLARLLATRADEVRGVDSDPAITAQARALTPEPTAASFAVADALTDLPAGPHDVITCVATLHHLPFTEALDTFREHMAPGGILVVVGLYRPRTVTDHLLGAGAVLPNAALGWLKNRAGPPPRPPR